MALADPLKVIEVNPRNIWRRCRMNQSTGWEKGSKLHDWGTVVSGDWDVAWRGVVNERLDGQPKRQAVCDRYTSGMPWEDTGIIDLLAPVPGKAHEGWNRAGLLARYARLDRVSGEHRPAIAVLLGLRTIPVYVMSRHDKWQRLRDRCAKWAGEGRLDRLELRHPDLQEFWA